MTKTTIAYTICIHNFSQEQSTCGSQESQLNIGASLQNSTQKMIGSHQDMLGSKDESRSGMIGRIKNDTHLKLILESVRLAFFNLPFPLYLLQKSCLAFHSFLYLKIRLRTRVFYERIMNEALPKKQGRVVLLFQYKL